MDACFFVFFPGVIVPVVLGFCEGACSNGNEKF